MIGPLEVITGGYFIFLINAIMRDDLKLRTNFPPYVSFYINLLVQNNKFNSAKKILRNAWSVFPHPYLKVQIINLAQKMKISFTELAKFIVANSSENSESKILLTEALIDEKLWVEARNKIQTLLEYKPSKEVCLLMAKIEEGESGDPQKIDAWVSRSNFGKSSKIWICRISKLSQNDWSSISKAGYFNSLDWKYPASIAQFSSSGVEMSSIGYIDN